MNLTGIVKNLIGEPAPGILEIDSDHYFRQETGSGIEIRVEKVRVDAPSGVFSVDLIPSGESTYRFRYFQETITAKFFRNQGTELWRGDTHQHTDGDWYTGNEHTSESEVLLRTETVKEHTIVPTFNATLPEHVESVDFADLLPSGVSPTNVEISLLTLAEMLTTRPEYLNPLASAVTENLPQP